jgi:hypothetical protein
MTQYQVLLERVKLIRDPLKRNLLFLGILTKSIEKDAVVPVIVGGFALEFYSTGGYSTGDIDILFPDAELLGAKLMEWGFRKEGRHWISEEYDMFIEIPGSTLLDEEQKRISVVEIEGLKVYIIGIEDLIIDRMNAFVHWKSTDDGYWAKELLFIHRDGIDREYLKRRSKEERTLADLEDLIEEVERLKNENH